MKTLRNKKKKRNNKKNRNNKNDKNNEKEEKKVEVIQSLNPIDYYFLTEILNKECNPPKKKSRAINLKLNNNFNFNKINIINTKNDKNTNRSILDCKMNEQDIIKKSKEIMEYNDEEINNLKYELALKYDKRIYIQYYISLLKTKHIFIFSFFYNKDYNLRIIKIDLFFINFAFSYAVNALFFNDNTMHKIFEDEGSFNFIYQLPQIVYSSLISTVLNILLKIISFI